MNRTLVRWLLRAYPPAWRARYAEEFEALLRAGPAGPRALLDVLRSALRERCSPSLEAIALMSNPTGSVLTLVRKPSAFVPMAMSIAALAVVLIDVGRFGVPPLHADEGTAAHLWQLLVACQVPLIGWFTVRWLRKAPRWSVLGVLGIQIGLVVVAMAPVFLLGL